MTGLRSVFSLIYRSSLTLLLLALYISTTYASPTKLFSMLDKTVLFSAPTNAGLFYLTSNGNIRSVEFYFYSSTDCSSGLQAGANFLVDNFLTSSTNIIANSPYYFDSASMFNIASNVLGSSAASNVQCIQAYLEGNNANSNTSQCISFQNENCSNGSSCTTA